MSISRFLALSEGRGLKVRDSHAVPPIYEMASEPTISRRAVIEADAIAIPFGNLLPVLLLSF